MSKKKNQFFDKDLYKEGIRQLRIPGVVSGAILLLCGILTPLMYMIELYETNRPQIEGAQTAIQTTDQVSLDLLSVNMLLWICPYLLAVLMTILLFRFLNQRSSSDFYHSVPQTRKCVSVSFLASALTWVVGLLVGIGLLSSLFAEALPYITMNWSEVFCEMVRLLTAAILAVGGTFLAMSVTGTIFTNFAVVVMILYVPTLLSMVLEGNIVSKLFFVKSIEEMLLCRYNNLTNGFCEIVDIGSMGGNLLSAVYTTILGVVYGSMGIYMYERRSSESAGQPACSRWLKAVFRVVPAFVLTLVPISWIYLDYITEAAEIFSLAVIYIVAVVIYFLYELFSTGKWKSALHSLKGLWLLAVLNLATLLILNGVTLYARNCIPETDEIVSVCFLEEGYDWYGIQLEETELTTEEIRRFVSEKLEYTIEYIDEDTYWNYDICQPVAIETKWGTLYRYLYLSYVQYQELTEMLADAEEYREVYMALPSLDDWEMYTDRAWKDENSTSRIYQVLQEEIQEIGFSKWYNYMKNNSMDCWVYLDFSSKDGYGYLYVPVSKSVLPKTYAQYIEELNIGADEETLQHMSSLLEKVGKNEVNSDIWFRVISVAGDVSMGENWVYSFQEEPEEWNSEGYEVTFSEEGLVNATTIVQSEAVESAAIEEDGASAYCATLLSRIFAREQLEQGDYLLSVYGEIYDDEEWFYLPDVLVYITEEEARALLANAAE